MHRQSASPRILSISLLALPLLVAAGVGCAGPRRLQLEQPFAPPSQKFVFLGTRTAACAETDGRSAVLVECPLPAAKDGPIAYSIFVDAPRTVGDFTIGEGSDAAHAMLIQRVGALAGKTVFDSGRATIQRTPLSANKIDITLELRAADATVIRGTLRATLDERTVRAFASAYRSDIDALKNPVATTSAVTQPRVAAEANTTAESAPAGSARADEPTDRNP